MTRAFLAAAGVLAALAANLQAEAGGAAPKAAEFRFAPKPAETVRHRISLKSVGTISLAPGLPGARFTQNTTQEIAARCREVRPDGSAVVDMELTRIATRMNTAGLLVDYDSTTFDAEKEQSPMVRLIGKVYSALIGSKLTVTFNRHGSPIQVTGMKEAVNKAIEPVRQELGNDAAGRSAGQLIDGITTMFDDATMTDQLKSFYRFVPDKTRPVAVGEKWQHDWTMSLAVLDVTCDAKGEYELLSYETFRGRPCARIGIKETFEMSSKKAAKPRPAAQTAPGLGRLLQNMDLSLSASGGTGMACWDYQTGVLVQLQQTQNITIDVRFKNRPSASASAPADSMPADEGPTGSLSQKFVTSVQIDLLDDEGNPAMSRPAGAEPAKP
ncbi:MAG TPA: DUF6263 family protein [Phycisphaerae bacterium]|nr:DUF6263 family protein [Phycisphaerae bacterium]